MKQNAYLYLFLLLFSLSACENDHNSNDNERIGGTWFVNNVRGDYRMYNGAYQETEDFINNFFYADYLSFITGDMFEFMPSSLLNITQPNNDIFSYHYLLQGHDLAITRDRNTSIYYADGNNNQLSIFFTKGTLLDYIRQEMHNKPQDQGYYNKMYRQVESQVQEFNVEYILNRRSPSLEQTFTGLFYGPLSDQDGIIYDYSSLTFEDDGRGINLFLNDDLALGNGGPFRITIPNIRITAGAIRGDYNFHAESNMPVIGYGNIHVAIQGVSYTGNFVDMDIRLLNNGYIYDLTYRKGIRYILTPENSYAARKKTKTAGRVIRLQPTKQ